MDFTFSAPTSISNFTFGSNNTTSITNGSSTTSSSSISATPSPSSAVLDSSLSSLEEHISLKRIHGVGDMKQWRRRLIHQIEDRIKDRREALHNAQRRGFSIAKAENTRDAAAVDHMSAIEGEQSIGFSGTSSRKAVLSGAESTDLASRNLFGQEPGGPGPGSGDGTITATGAGTEGAMAPPYISEDEERRIVAEVWETFKNENYEALAQAFQGMTDKEIEEIEHDILQYNYSTDSDPMYESLMDMEDNIMEEYVQQYISQPEEDKQSSVNDKMTAALSVAWSLLSQAPCIRCHRGSIFFEPVLADSLAEGARAICSSRSDFGAEEANRREGCGFRLERDALLYLANISNTHSRTCTGQLQIAFDEEMGLLLACPLCEFLA
ncbi:hypothetical protein FBU30_007065 [Linnemannia zychae]|nr:hypothetical protein FBU30_007065 [Linnemannia zychae]